MHRVNTKRFNGALRALAIGVSLGLSLALSACGGGGSDLSSPSSAPTLTPTPTPTPTPTALTYFIGGTVTGLNAGATLVLKNNGTDTATVTANGAFAFPGALTSGAVYAVTVGTRPNYQSCTISNSTGSIASANVTNVSVTCATNGPQYAYVANQFGNNISAYSIDATTGALTPVAGSPFAMGAGANGPTSVTMNPAGTYAFVVNTGSNNISVYSIDAATGALTPVAGSPFAMDPGASNFPPGIGFGSTGITVNSAGTYAYVANTASNNISVYSIDVTTGALASVAGSPFAMDPGTNFPNQITLNAAGTYGYVANAGSNNISVYSIDGTTGALTPVAGSPFATGAGANWPTSVAMNPAGTYAFVANTGGNNISVYSIDAITGALTPVTGSPFAMDPGAFNFPPGLGFGTTGVTVNSAGTYAYVTNTASNNISVYSIDATTGALASVAGSPFAMDPSTNFPSQVTLNPAGAYAYVGNTGSNNISIYSIDATTGALTLIGSPVATGSFPGPVSIERVR